MSSAAVQHSGARHARSRQSSTGTPVMSARSRRPATRESTKRATSAGTGKKQSGRASTKHSEDEKKVGTLVTGDVEDTPRTETESSGTGNVPDYTRPKSAGADSVRTELIEQEPHQTVTITEQPDGPAIAFSPAPEVLDEEETPEITTGMRVVDGRPLSAYSEVVDPEDFDSKSFLSGISDLSVRLQDDCYRNLDPSSPTRELEEMVTAVSATVSNFLGYAIYAQKQMEGLRDQMKTVKDRMHKKIQQKAYDPTTASERSSVGERQLDAKLAQLNKDLARTAEELARACAVSAESEAAAIQAALVSEKAMAEAAKTQAEYESRREAELEARRSEESRRRAEEARARQEAERAEEARRAEEERRARLRRGGEPNSRVTEWESWPLYSYEKSAVDFDHGVACLVRANPALVKESWVRADVVDQRVAGFVYGLNEELVSNVVRLAPASEGDQLPAPIYVVLPHCTSRVSAMTREPVIKADIGGTWVELKTQEVTIEDKKDVKFVQAEVKQFTTLAVVTRFKRDFLQIPKRGGKETSKVDSRVTFLGQRGTFKRTENFVLQLQPVDSASVAEVKARPEAAGLLCASSIVNMQWTSPSFDLPVTMTLPCPPNPVKAKKAAAVRAAKEAKMKNPVPSPLQLLEEAKRREEQQERPAPPKNRWYMGQYSMNDDEDNDLLYMVSQNNGKWSLVEGIDILQARLDLLQFDLNQPIDRFCVLRTRPTVDEKQALQMAALIESQLCQRHVTAVIKQREDDVSKIRLHVVPETKTDKVLRELSEDGYDVGPSPSPHLHLREGDLLEVNFRGNITCRDDDDVYTNEDETSRPGPMTLVYNSHLGTSVDFWVREVDCFLQKNYNAYRGFVQVFREVRTTCVPTKADQEEGRTLPWVEVTKELVTELLITIPKERPSTPVRRPVAPKAPIVLRNVNDPITEDTLRDVAAELGDEWKRLAHYLNVKRMRIQAILRNCNQQEEDSRDALEDAKYEMLLTWVKRVPRGVGKVPLLCQALVRSGRADLAERLNDLDKEFQGQRRTHSSEQ